MSDRVSGAPSKIETAVLLTHTDPDGTLEAAQAAAAAAERAGCRLVAAQDELDKHAGIDGIEAVAELPERSRPLPRPRRRRDDPQGPSHLRRVGRPGVRDQLRDDRLPRGGRAR